MNKALLLGKEMSPHTVGPQKLHAELLSWGFLGLDLTMHPQGFNQKEEKCILQDMYIELGKSHIALSCAGFPTLCYDTYPVSFHIKVGAPVCQGELWMMGSRESPSQTW